MEMNAITQHYGAGESAVLAALAGEDVIFFSHTPEYQQQAYDALLNAARSGRLPESSVDESVRRIDRLIERFPLEPRPPLEVIRSPQHLAVVRKAAEAALSLPRFDPRVFPLRLGEGKRIGMVEFSSFMDTPALESGDQSALVNLLRTQAPEIETVSLASKGFSEETGAAARRLASEADVLLLVTRNAHLWPGDKAFARELMALANDIVLVCMADPYDANVLPGANTVLCTFGDSAPLLQAAIDALLGRLQPHATPPVPVMVG
jgi:beta-N-acetylhexosaminidase